GEVARIESRRHLHGGVMRQRKTKRAIERIAYSPSGRLLVARDGSGDVHVFEAATLDPVETIAAGDARARLLDCLFRAGGQLFLQTQGYCSAKQDLPAGAPSQAHQALLPG